MKVILWLADVFQTPAIFISLIACVGLILQKKSLSDILKGTFKTMLGILVLLAGSEIIQGAIAPLTAAFTVMNNRTGGAELADFGAFMGQMGAQIGIIIVLGFILNCVIARFTPLKTVYLTGHMMLFYAMLWCGLSVGFGLSGTKMIIFALIGYLLSITITPQLLMKDMEHLTGKREFSIGHSGTLWCFLAARVGQLAGKTYKDEEPKSMEKIAFPKSIAFLKDTTLVGGLIMVVFYAILAFILPAEARTEIYGSNAFTFVLTEGMTFGAGMVILLQGCRMMMAEIIPAFTGISKKLVKGAVPALDIPMIYPYGPNSLMFGYIFALIGSTITMFAINGSGISAYVLVPITAAVYFDVSSGCVFANHYGGVRGVILWGLIGGAGIMIVTALAMPLVATTVGTFVQTMGFSECSIWIIIVGYITRLFYRG